MLGCVFVHRRNRMSDHYDVIVTGAGIGGSCTANPKTPAEDFK